MQDNVVINKAEKLMNEEINQRMMPPPSLPVTIVTYSISLCVWVYRVVKGQTVKRITLQSVMSNDLIWTHHRPPHSNEDNNSDNTSCSTVIRTTSIASTLSTQSSNGHST